ncbi:MAG: porin [Advenella sp.]|uniref:porin n=1 Tax=Advenella alkanexedens TaxID=1481665 RepID=UPI002676459C|nr:porin [Advenella alkanexedens]MDY0270981.1 porin [Advenella sp.]WKU20058.1 porin [Advenella alkanexedens]
MKKTLLASALVAGFSGSAYANGSVTLYGLVDGGIAYQKNKVTQGDNRIESRDFGMAKFNGVRNGNRWGVRGSEDLGNGTKAVFQLESGFDLMNGKQLQGGRLFGRQAYFGLSNERWGSLTLGRQHSIAVDTVGTKGPFNVGYQQAGHLFGAFGASVFARMDNAIKYWTPNLSGFKFGLGYAGNNTKTETEWNGTETNTKGASNWITAGGSYNNGPLAIGVSYDRFRTDVQTATDQHKGTVHMWNLFGTYDFEIVKLDLGYGQVRGAIGNKDGAAAKMEASSIGLNNLFTPFTQGMRADGLLYSQTKGYRQQAWSVALSTPVGEAGKAMFSYQGSATKNRDEGFNGVKGSLSIFSLGYEHSLSKRTLIYAVASVATGSLKFDDRAVNPKAKLKTSLVGVGLQHRF